MAGIGTPPALNLSVGQTKGQIQGESQEQGRSARLLDLGQKRLDLCPFSILSANCESLQTHRYITKARGSC